MKTKFIKVIYFKWINKYTKCEYFVICRLSDYGEFFFGISDLYKDSLDIYINQLEYELLTDSIKPIFTNSKVIINLLMDNDARTYEEIYNRKKLAFNLI